RVGATAAARSAGGPAPAAYPPGRGMRWPAPAGKLRVGAHNSGFLVLHAADWRGVITPTAPATREPILAFHVRLQNVRRFSPYYEGGGPGERWPFPKNSPRTAMARRRTETRSDEENIIA